MTANRNGFFYVLDRLNGELLLAKPFTSSTWAREIRPDGRPIVRREYLRSSGDDVFAGWPAVGADPVRNEVVRAALGKN